MSRAVACLAWLFLTLGGINAVCAASWETLDIPETGVYARWYLPDSAPSEGPHPVILFLHGAGSTPEAWMPFLRSEAEATGALLLVPKSVSPFGWGVGNDLATLHASLARLGELVEIDRLRVGLAGHSSGGAFAYVAGLAGDLRVAGIFALAAPFRTVLEVADSSYVPPLRLYYGTEDPNHDLLPPLQDMFDRLEVDTEVQVATGHGHSSWPVGTLTTGFQFLLARSYPGPCVSSPALVCLRQGRFSVEVEWRDHRGRTGVGTVVPGQADDSALFWFFDEANWELLVKVIDGCAFNQRYWVFGAAATDVEYRIRVRDLVRGEDAEYFNPLGRQAPAINDTSALAVCP